jgi:hypothetical protein
MSPESKQRIGRVISQTWAAATGRGNVSNGTAFQAAQTYAQTILESIVEEEVQRRLAAREAG